MNPESQPVSERSSSEFRLHVPGHLRTRKAWPRGIALLCLLSSSAILVYQIPALARMREYESSQWNVSLSPGSTAWEVHERHDGLDDKPKRCAAAVQLTMDDKGTELNVEAHARIGNPQQSSVVHATLTAKFSDYRALKRLDGHIVAFGKQATIHLREKKPGILVLHARSIAPADNEPMKKISVPFPQPFALLPLVDESQAPHFQLRAPLGLHRLLQLSAQHSRPQEISALRHLSDQFVVVKDRNVSNECKTQLAEEQHGPTFLRLDDLAKDIPPGIITSLAPLLGDEPGEIGTGAAQADEHFLPTPKAE